jgi:hypothetical protein
MSPDAAAAELRAAMSACDCDCWESDSSMVEPAAVLARPVVVAAFLEVSFSRGSSWQRWPMLRLIHLVQGRSY